MQLLGNFFHNLWYMKVCAWKLQSEFKTSFFPRSARLISLQIHSKHQKLIPNHCATLGKWLGSTFDHLNEFKTTFGKSNFGAQKALFPYWRLRRLQNQAFHEFKTKTCKIVCSLKSTFWEFFLQNEMLWRSKNFWNGTCLSYLNYSFIGTPE